MKPKGKPLRRRRRNPRHRCLRVLLRLSPALWIIVEMNWNSESLTPLRPRFEMNPGLSTLGAEEEEEEKETKGIATAEFTRGISRDGARDILGGSCKVMEKRKPSTSSPTREERWTIELVHSGNRTAIFSTCCPRYSLLISTARIDISVGTTFAIKTWPC